MCTIEGKDSNLPTNQKMVSAHKYVWDVAIEYVWGIMMPDSV